MKLATIVALVSYCLSLCWSPALGCFAGFLCYATRRQQGSHAWDRHAVKAAVHVSDTPFKSFTSDLAVL